MARFTSDGLKHCTTGLAILREHPGHPRQEMWAPEGLYNMRGFTLWLILGFGITYKKVVCSQASSPFGITRGGGSVKIKSFDNDGFDLLATFVQERFQDSSHEKICKTLVRLGSAQQTFKGLDGAAHEAYQRTHSVDDIDTAVAGRAQRSAARIAATAEALLACELIELVREPNLLQNDTLVGRRVVLNISATDGNVTLADSNLSVLVLYEESYDRGAGLEHGTIDSLAVKDSYRRGRKPRGRLIVVLGDDLSEDLVETITILNQAPQRVKLSSGLVTNEVASVQPTLYKSAGKLLNFLEPHLRQYNTTAVHFVGRSLAGGVASLAATILDGTIPMPKAKKSKRKASKKTGTKLKDVNEVDVVGEMNNTAINEEAEVLEPLNGLGRARSSAMTLGAPPCLSSNVQGAYCTSILFGDDIVCRTTHDSIERLFGRIERSINGGFVGRNIGWMSDTVSLTMSSLKSHAHGSEGEEAKLSIPGRAYLIRPRRLGGFCSVHEVGNMKKGGREALRANLLWQLNDVLLSKSMWKHHQLESYIQGLDRVHLRGSLDDGESMY